MNEIDTNKYRIVQELEVYWPQKRILFFFWENLWYTPHTSLESAMRTIQWEVDRKVEKKQLQKEEKELKKLRKQSRRVVWP
jgi:hypothetical protein